MAQLGVTILDSLEEEALDTIETAEIADLPTNQIFNTDNQITTVSEAEADTQDEVIARRKQLHIEKIYLENIKAVGNIFVNMVAANGQIDKNRKIKKQPTSTTPIASMQSYNLKGVNNMVDAITTAGGGTTIDAIPNQIRSLMFSDTSATPTDFLNAPVDMLKNPETAQMMRTNFDTLSRVEVFVGFKRDSSGDNIIDKPKYELLKQRHMESANSRVLLCRIKKYENKSLNIGQNKGLNLQIYDNCFLMSASELKLLLTEKRQLSKRVISINQSALANLSALEESVAFGLAEKSAAEQAAIATALAEQAAEAAEELAEMAAAKELEERKLEELQVESIAELETIRADSQTKKAAARMSFQGGGAETVFDFLYNWIATNSDLKRFGILKFLATVDLDDRNSLINWLTSNTSPTQPEIREFLGLLATMLFEEVIVEDIDNLDRDVLNGFTGQQKNIFIDWLHTRGGFTFDDIDEIFSKVTNFQRRRNVKTVLKTWTDISIDDIEDMLDTLYGKTAPRSQRPNQKTTPQIETTFSPTSIGTPTTQTPQTVAPDLKIPNASVDLVTIVDQDDDDEVITMIVDMQAMDQFEGAGDEQSSGDTQDDVGEKDISSSAVFKTSSAKQQRKRKRRRQQEENATTQSDTRTAVASNISGDTWAVDQSDPEDPPNQEENLILDQFIAVVGGR